jgi:hypothetical protein
VTRTRRSRTACSPAGSAGGERGRSRQAIVPAGVVPRRVARRPGGRDAATRRGRRTPEDHSRRTTATSSRSRQRPAAPAERLAVEDDVRSLCLELGRAEWADEAATLARTSVRLTPGDTGRSWLGGTPDVATAFAWPTWEGVELDFLARISLEGLPPHTLAAKRRTPRLLRSRSRPVGPPSGPRRRVPRDVRRRGDGPRTRATCLVHRSSLRASSRCPPIPRFRSMRGSSRTGWSCARTPRVVPGVSRSTNGRRNTRRCTACSAMQTRTRRTWRSTPSSSHAGSTWRRIPTPMPSTRSAHTAAPIGGCCSSSRATRRSARSSRTLRGSMSGSGNRISPSGGSTECAAFLR